MGSAILGKRVNWDQLSSSAKKKKKIVNRITNKQVNKSTQLFSGRHLVLQNVRDCYVQVIIKMSSEQRM